jgi:hypothetical protein
MCSISDSVTAAPTPTDDAAYPCICGSCDRSSCSETSCNNGEAPFCGTNTGCSYVKGSTPPVEISLAFVDVRYPPAFNCIQVQLQGGCTVAVPLTNGLFSINKDQCKNVNNGNVKLNPDLLLMNYGTIGADGTCNYIDKFPDNPDKTSKGIGTDIHTSCSSPVYAGQRIVTIEVHVEVEGEVEVVDAELFIAAFCNAGPGGSEVCIGTFDAEEICDGSIFHRRVASTSSVVGQAETSMVEEELMTISDFQSVLEDSYNASVKSKVSASILGVIMMLGWYQHQ